MARRTTPQVTTKTVALVGPMKGYENDNYEAFDAAAAVLREHLGDEWVVLNPTENHNGDHDLPWTHYMITTLDKIRTVDYVVALDGWQSPDATGARQEIAYAISLGIPVVEYCDCCGFDINENVLDLFDLAARDFVKALHNGDDFGWGDREEESTPSILITAEGLVNGDRAQAYDHPIDNFRRIVNLWNAYLVDKLGDGQLITEEDHALMMIMVKMARLQHTENHLDSVVDIAGYAATYQKVVEAKAEAADAAYETGVERFIERLLDAIAESEDNEGVRV